MQYIAFIYNNTEDNDFVAIVPDLFGCLVYGDDYEEASEMIQEATELWLEDEELPQAHSDEYFTAEVLTELNIPLNSSKIILNVNEEDEKSYNVDIVD